MGLTNLLNNGGRVLVVGGFNKAWESFRKFDQLEFWSGEQKDIIRAVRDKEVPANCKAIIISRFISHAELNKIMQTARNRGITLFPNKNDGEISSLLDQMTAELPSMKPVAVKQEEFPSIPRRNGGGWNKGLTGDANKKGKLLPLVPFIDWSKNNTENAKFLLDTKCKELGITTTHLSLSNFVGTQRKKRDEAPTKKMAHVKASNFSEEQKLDLTVQMLDSMIRDMMGMRDFLIATTAENTELKQRFETLKGLFIK